MGLILFLFAVMLVAPHMSVIDDITATKQFLLLVNYPLVDLAIIVCLVAIAVCLGVKRLHGLIRLGAMLTLGFSAYVGWALGDYSILIASVTAGLGLFLATLANWVYLRFPVILLSLVGSAFLAYLAISGYFDEFLYRVQFEFVSVKMD